MDFRLCQQSVSPVPDHDEHPPGGQRVGKAVRDHRGSDFLQVVFVITRLREGNLPELSAAGVGRVLHRRTLPGNIHRSALRHGHLFLRVARVVQHGNDPEGEAVSAPPGPSADLLIGSDPDLLYGPNLIMVDEGIQNQGMGALVEGNVEFRVKIVIMNVNLKHLIRGVGHAVVGIASVRNISGRCLMNPVSEGLLRHIVSVAVLQILVGKPEPLEGGVSVFVACGGLQLRQGL